MSYSDVIVLKNVHAYYGASHVLRGINLRLAPRSCLSLMGRNGMGKSTTLKAIMGIVIPRRGAVNIKGVCSNGLSPNVVANACIAYVPEERAIFPNLTVRENLYVAARPSAKGKVDWDLGRILDLFPRLSERLHHWGNNLSGGEQQRVAIARALATSNPILLADEPTGELDFETGKQILKLLVSQANMNRAVLVVSHNREIAQIADRVIQLSSGQIISDGPPIDGKKDVDALRW